MEGLASLKSRKLDNKGVCHEGCHVEEYPRGPRAWSGRTDRWIFRARASHPSAIIEAGESANFNCSIVNFSQGCNTGWHVHDCDQILIVTSGSGWVATEVERHEIKVGDVAHVKAGERHWHGAKADTTMDHITITLASGKATWG
jgi:quercetin dioxygenase-like cupin family protein